MHLSGKLRDNLVGCDEREPLDMGLGEQHAVEWVFMDWREIECRHGMFARDVEFTPAVVDGRASQTSRLDAEIRAAKPVLDRDFPKARRAERQLRVGIFENSARFPRQFLRLACRLA